MINGMKKILIFLFVMLSFGLFAQVQTNTLPYSITSANLELNYQPMIVALDASSFVSISKTKGTTASESEYVMEKYTDQLNKEVLTTFTLKATEDIQELRVHQSVIQLFINEHDVAAANSILKVRLFQSIG
jgi:hypothetical protein